MASEEVGNGWRALMLEFMKIFKCIFDTAAAIRHESAAAVTSNPQTSMRHGLQ